MASANDPSPSPSSLQNRLSLEKRSPLAERVAVWEPRFALSASAAADAVLQTLNSLDPSLSAPQVGSDPFTDAASARELHSFAGRGQTVAVIDSGVAWDHVVFATGNARPTAIGNGNRIVGGWDFAENDANPYDDGPAGFHGTHVAGIVAGQSSAFAGVAPAADVVALRVFDDVGRSSLDWIESALRWVIDHRTRFENPITTVNLSVGAFAVDPSQPLTQLDDELRSLREQNVLVVAAAGNSFKPAQPNSLAYPASHPLVAAVTSIDTSGELHAFAQRAAGAFALPGAAIRSSVPDHVFGVDGRINDFSNIDGTSMAAPQFAGASMLVREALLSTGAQPSVDDILQVLRDTAVQRTDRYTGATYFAVDLDAAIASAIDASPTGQSEDPASPLRWTGPGSLSVSTTDNTDLVELHLGNQASLRINGTDYSIDRPLERLTLHGAAGNDTLRIFGGMGDERLIGRAAVPGVQDTTASLERPGLTADVLGFESVIFQGGGGNDRATFFDSVGNDTFEADPRTATLRGVGYTFVALDVRNVYAHGTQGGSDQAFLYDSAVDDRLAIRHQFTSLRSDTQFRLAYGFERVQAFGGSGGNDVAELFDSPGDDRLSASANFVSISSRDFYAGARGFASIRAEASAGGNDYAALYAVDTSAFWLRTVDSLQWSVPGGETRIARGFETAEAFVANERIQVLPQSLKWELYQHERLATRQALQDWADEEARLAGQGPGR